MSTIQPVTCFEYLPNEIIIECFEYLNAVDIFHSFDQLNYRFNQLIRNIPLYLDIQTIQRLKLDQFYKKMFSNPEIKKQIYSLQLSNKGTYCQIDMFLSDFSPDQFSNLRSLTLRGVKEDNVSQLKLMLPLLSQLSSLRLINCQGETNEILSILHLCKIHTLTAPKLFSDTEIIYDISSIINLTIFICNTDELSQILNNGSRLKYLNVQIVYKCWRNTTENNKYSTKHHAIKLNQLVITQFSGVFGELVKILKQTPNLKSLTICSDNNIEMIDADQWQHLISSSLPDLNIFKFKFRYEYHGANKGNTMHEKWTQFQSGFWHKQHQWYTEYSLSKNSASIYTIPYISERFVLTPYTRRCYNKLMSNTNTFDNITDLVIYPDAIKENCQYHFSNVMSLELGDSSAFADDSLLDEKQIESLKMIVNLSNVKDLKIWSKCKLKTPSVLLEILKQAPQLSAISIDKDGFTSLFENDELCKYLNKMIKNLKIWNSSKSSFNSSHETDQFCKIFSNIEQLMCRIQQLDSLLFLLKTLPKLSYIDASLASSTDLHELFSFEEKVHKLYEKIIIDVQIQDNIVRSIYIIRDMY
jgi:hypothetical protein